MIVTVNQSNLSEAAKVHAVAWQASHQSFCTPEFVMLHTPERQAAYLNDKMEAGSKLYLLITDIPVGVVSVTGNLIEDLYVLPERQNRGYGTELLQFAIEICTDTPILWILENNERAKRLYERFGFSETGRRNAITDVLDEIEMSWTKGTAAGGNNNAV